MRALKNILLLAVTTGLCGLLHASVTLKNIPTESSERVELLGNAMTHGAKEIFVYNPKNHQSEDPKTIGAKPEKSAADEILSEDTTNLSIRPNFENADLENFINYVAQLTNINVIPTKDTQGVKVSLNMRSNLTKKAVWEVFLTVTEMAGFTINKSGNVYKVLRQDAKKTEPLPAYINVPASTLPDSDQSIRFVTFLRNIQASEVEPLLKGMLGSGGDLLRQDNVNGFIITDKCYNIKSAMAILNELDDAGLQEVVSVLPLKKTDATEVKKLLDDMTKNASDKSNNAIVARLLGKTQESSEYFSAATKIIVEDRSNSLILLGNQKSIKKIEDFIAQYIEREDPAPESPIHRYQLEYMDAADLKSILDSIVNSQSESGAEKYGGVRNGGKYFKRMRFEVDKESNSLLVSSLDKNDWQLLKKTIRDLDRPQPQCAIETLIVDIDLRNVKELGSQLRMPRADQPFPNIGWQSAAIGPVVTAGSTGSKTLMGDLGSMLSGLTQGYTAFALSRTVGNVWAVFSVLNQNFNTSLVNNSFMTVANRVAASFSVGETRRVISQQYSGGSSTVPSYENKQAATTFSYTPQINSDGLINLSVKISMNSFNADNGQSTKDFQTTLACANGQVLVLGGFVKTKATESQTDGMPLLSQVPVLGWLFKDKNRDVSKTYTFFFICPTILKPRQKPGVDMYTKMKLHRARREVESSILTSSSKDPIHNLFFNSAGENYHHKVDDFANARFQPSTVDIRHDPFYNPGIAEKKQLDFQDEYAGNDIVKKLVDADTPANELSSKEPAQAAQLQQERAGALQENSREEAVIPEQDSIIKKLSGSLPRKENVTTPLKPYTFELPALPPISHEKRVKFKEALDTLASSPSAAPAVSLNSRRNALKELLSADFNPSTYKRASQTPAQNNESVAIEEDAQLAPLRSTPITESLSLHPAESLIAEQEAKRNKFKQSLTFDDRTNAPEEAPITARRRSLKELLASYPSGKQTLASNTQPF